MWAQVSQLEFDIDLVGAGDVHLEVWLSSAPGLPAMKIHGSSIILHIEYVWSAQGTVGAVMGGVALLCMLLVSGCFLWHRQSLAQARKAQLRMRAE